MISPLAGCIRRMQRRHGGLQHRPVHWGRAHPHGAGGNPLCKDFQGEVTPQHDLQKDWEAQFHQQAGKRQNAVPHLHEPQNK